MYHFLVLLQYFGIFALIVEIFYVSRQQSSKLQMALVLLLYSSLINIVGYTMEIQAGKQQVAIQATKFSYYGKPFVVFFMYMFIMEYCNLVVPKLRRNILFGICILICGLVSTNEYHHLYYSSVSYTEKGMFPHLILNHGVLYNLYNVFIAYYFIVILWAAIRKLRQTKSLIIRKQLLMILGMVLLSMLSLVLFLLHLTNGYDTTAPAYLAAAFIFERLMRKYRLFDTLTLAQEEAVNHMANGLIVIGTAGEVIYSNEEADRILNCLEQEEGKRELEDLKKLAEKQEYLFLDKCAAEDGEKHHTTEKCVYELALHDISKGENNYGQTLTMAEITDRYYYTERLQRDLRSKTR